VSLVPRAADGGDHLVDHCGAVFRLADSGRSSGRVGAGADHIVNVIAVGNAGGHEDHNIRIDAADRADGRFHWIAADSAGALWDGGGPIMVGQDKTGQYFCGADLCFDELRAWPRPLSTTDLKGVFDRDRRRK